MHISPYSEYVITNRNPETANRFITVETKAATMSALISDNTVRIDEIHTYEIYTKNAETNVGGWSIHLVRSTDYLIKMYPLFDCIITKNDCTADIDFIDFEEGHASEEAEKKRINKINQWLQANPHIGVLNGDKYYKIVDGEKIILKLFQE